jgi:hypothetical protein
MFIFGWGKRNISKAISEKKAVVLSYSYFSLFFVFTVTFRYRYNLATLAEEGWHHKAISDEEAAELMGGSKFVPHWWWRFSLAGLVALIVIIALISSISSHN